MKMKKNTVFGWTSDWTCESSPKSNQIDFYSLDYSTLHLEKRTGLHSFNQLKKEEIMSTRLRIVFLFYIKRTKLLQNGEAPIYLKIKVDRASAELAILKTIDPNLWSVEKNGASGTTKEANDINSYLSHIRQQVNNHLAVMRDEGREITARGLKNAFLGINPDEKTIATVFEEHNKSVKMLIGKDFVAATHQRYCTCLSHVKSYMRDKYKAADLPLSKLNVEFINGFEFYLKTSKNCCHNTTMKYIKNFKKVVRICIGNGWLKYDPFTNIKHRLKKVDKIFLSEDEIKAINNKHFSSERLQQVADVFLFACHTGYAYSDLKRLSQENLVKAENGQMWIHAKRLKTDMISHVPLLPIAEKILNKYRNHSYCKKHNVLLPVLSNQKMNSYLQEIADFCSITKKITTHIARHTFATTVTLNNDIPIESVSKMLGHSSIAMTQNYAKLLDKKVGKDMSKLKDKFSFEDAKIDLSPCLN